MEAKLQPSRTALIELTGADIPSRGDPGVRTVAGVDWTVEEGDFWVIGGLQGTGKSDLLCVAAGLSRPLAGTCRIFGRELAPSYRDECLSERLRLALVFGEGGRLLSHLPVIENIALPLKYHRGDSAREIEARVRGLMAAMDLENLGARLPSRLNPSWRQRVALARALAMRPEVLLLDNPTAGLDPRHTRWWTDFVGQLAGGHPVMDNRPVTVAVATDDVRPWGQAGRRFARLSDGRLVLADDPSALEHPEASIQHETKADKPQRF